MYLHSPVQVLLQTSIVEEEEEEEIDRYWAHQLKGRLQLIRPIKIERSVDHKSKASILKKTEIINNKETCILYLCFKK